MVELHPQSVRSRRQLKPHCKEKGLQTDKTKKRPGQATFMAKCLGLKGQSAESSLPTKEFWQRWYGFKRRNDNDLTVCLARTKERK